MNRIFAIIAAVLLAMVVAVLVAPSFLDWNRYKPQIAARISALAGHPVEIGGSVAVQLLPRPFFSATDVRLGDDSRSGTAERVDAALPFRSLLRGNFEPSSLTLVRPAVSVGIDDLSVGNLASVIWFGGASAGSGMDSLIVEGGIVHVTVDEGEIAETLRDVNLAFSRAGARGAYRLSGDLHLKNRPVTMTADVGSPASGEIPVSLQVRLAASDTRGSLYGNLIGVDTAARFAGEARLEGPDLGGLMELLSGGRDRRSPGTGGEPDQPFDIRTAVDLTDDALRLENVSADVAGVLARGGAALSRSPEGLRAEADFRAGRVDLDRILAAGGGLDAASLWGLGERVGAAGLSGSLGLEVDALIFNGGMVRGARLLLTAEQGDISVEGLTAGLPGAAELMLSGQLLAAGPEPRLSMGLQGRAGDLRRTLHWMGYPLPTVAAGRLRAGSISATLTSDGKTATLSGIQAEIDATTVQGGLTVSLGERTAFGLSLAADRIDWDSYFPESATPNGLIAEIARLVGPDPASRIPELTSFDANLQMRVDQLNLGGTLIQGAALDALLFEGRLDLRGLGYEWALGTRGRLSGRVADLGGAVHGTFGFRAEVEDLPRILRDLSVPMPPAFERGGMAVLEGTATGNLEEIDFGLDLQGQGFVANLGGSLRDAVNALRYEVDVSVRTGEEPGGGPAETTLGFRAEGGSSAAIVRELRLSDGGTTLAGRADVEWTDSRPAIRASLTSAALDLRRAVLPSTAEEATDPFAGLVALAQLVARDHGTELSVLGGLDADVVLVAGSLDLSPETRLEGVEVSAALASGVLELRRFEGRYAGGRFEMTGRLAVPDDPVLSASIRIAGAETNALGLSMGALSVAGGTFDLTFAMEGGVPPGATGAETVRGRGALELRNGTIELSTLSGEEPGNPNELLTFSSVTAPFVLADDRIVAPELVLSTDRGRARGSVEIDLAGRSVSGELVFIDGERAGTVMDLAGPL